MRLFTKQLAICVLMAVTVSLFISCGDDTPAEVEAPKDKFLGDYVGAVTCAGILATVVNEPALPFTITNTSPAQDDMVQLNMPTLTIPLELVGTVSGNNITMEPTTVEDFMITEPIPQTLDITAVGSATLAGNALDATIDLEGKTPGGATLASDRCTVVATKQ